MREDWVNKKLSEIGRLQTGTTPSTRDKSNYGDYIPFIKPAHFNKDGSIDSGDSYLSETGLKKGRLFEKNSVLMVCIGATIGKTGYVTESVSSNQQINVLTPYEDFDYKFIYYAFISPFFQTQIQIHGTSAQATLPIINKTKWSNLEIPIPPLPEQKAIVKILDKAFAKIDQAKANIEKNIENAKELYQSKLNEVFSQRGEGWEEKSLGEVCTVLNGYAFKSKDVVEKSNTQLLRMGNLYQNILDLGRKPVFYPVSFSNEFKDYLLKEGDLIMSLTGTVDKTDYGYTVKIPNVDVQLLLNQRIMKIMVINNDILDNDFLKNFLLSPDFLKRMYATASGTRQANLSSKTILTLNINYPKRVADQHQIVSELKTMREKSIILEKEYIQKVNALNELKKSLLQKAFSGELTKSEAVA